MEVKTTRGRIQGIETEDAYVYLGVPYARPPIGERRFRAPIPVEPWEGVRKADRFPNRCMQPGEKQGSFYYKEFFSDSDFVPPMSEDCLYLNLWVPKEAEKSDQVKKPFPVAVWFHGGGFIGGHSTEIEFDGNAYAKRGILLITVGYRLGIFGCFCHEILREQGGESGNFGQRDQIAALDWVQENIVCFGGDPGCVTVFGQSAGGMGVRNLVASPLARGKIHRAIIQSCNGYKGSVKADFPRAFMENLWEKFLKKQKISFADFCRLPAEELVEQGNAFNRFAAFRTRSGLSMTPVVGDEVLPVSADQAAEEGQTLTIPYMTGATRDDMGVGLAGKKDYRKNALLKSLAKWSEMHSRRGVDSFVYYFGRSLPGDRAGAFHSSELWYMFGTLGRSWRPMEKHDYELSERMLDAWASFMRTGNPGWEAYREEGGYIQIFQ